jgi:hypothetical protein
LAGDQLLARGGFDDLPSGCRIGAATTPAHGEFKQGEIRWHTYVRDNDGSETDDDRFDPTLFTHLLVTHSLVGRLTAERTNPYLPRAAVVDPHPERTVSMLSPDAAAVHLVDDGGAVVADLGVLGLTEAGRIADIVTASGAAIVTPVAIGVS